MSLGLGKKYLGLEVLLAAVLGIFTGIFLGPLSNFFQPIGDAFVLFLQMVVLPYICFSIIHGLGSITPLIAKRLFKKGWIFWVILWSATFLVIFLFYQMIPEPIHGPAFPENYSSMQKSLAKSVMSYLIPDNPFYDFANNIVPAVAVFGVVVGLALMHIQKKEPLLGLLERANEIIEKILTWIAAISPIGIFAHLAVISGTAQIDDLHKIAFYVIAFICITLFFVFVFLPCLLSSLTPMNYMEVLKAFESVCLLSFITGLPTIAIPFLNMYLKKIGAKHRLLERGFHSTQQTVMPLGYAFAQIGNALLLFFILFLSFYYRHPFTFLEKGALSFLTIPLSIGASGVSINAVSFVIEALGFPKSAIDLYTQTMAITLNFQVLLSVASILSFSLFVLFSYYRLLKPNWRTFFVRGGGSLAILAFSVFLVKPLIHLNDKYRSLYMHLSIDKAIEHPVQAKVYSYDETVPASTNDSMAPLERILHSGILRVGYHPEVMPYSYFNASDQLVGYDIAMAYELARDLDCRLEFIPIQIDSLSEELNQNRYDIAMSAIIMSEERIQKVEFSHFYTEQNNVLLIKTKNKRAFSHLSKIQKERDIKIGATGAYQVVFDRHFPNAQLVHGTLDDFLKNKADAWIWSHVPASIWCINHPGYSVAEYGSLLGKLYFSYPVKMGASEFLSFLNNWMILKQQSGFTHMQYRYWIHGTLPPKPAEKRWSILRNVLHWVD